MFSVALLLCAFATVAACNNGLGASAPPASLATHQVNIAVTDAECVPDPTSVPAGGVVFSINVESGNAVFEVELFEGEHFRRLGEIEGLSPGMNGTFALDLEPGSYVIFCPGAAQPQTPFEVSGVLTTDSPDTELDQLLSEATDGYGVYVRDQAGRLVAATNAFTAAVKAGSIDDARSLYGPARLYYERLEPVAESFGDPDPLIDGQEDDAATPEQFTGFHRLEKALWMDNSVVGMTPIADKLSSDVAHLNDLVATADYQPAQLANGASALIDQIIKFKITGDEERYSHLDLLALQGNLEGARRAYDLLSRVLRIVDPDLKDTISERFTAVEALLAQHRQDDGYVPYTELTSQQKGELAEAVNALAKPMSQVAAKLVSH